MPTYRVYFLDKANHIFDAHYFEAADDDAAISQADRFCEAKPNCASIEIWQGARRLHRQERAA